MQRFALFVALAAVFFGCGEWLARRMHRGATDLDFKAQAFYGSPCTYQTIVIGSSWAEESVIPARLNGGGFNLGYPLQDVYYASELLRRVVLPRCSSLRRAIIVVGYPWFDWDLLTDWDNSLAHEYARNFGIPVRGGWAAALRSSNYLRHLSLLYETRQRFIFDLVGFKPPYSVSWDTFALPPHWPDYTLLADGYRFSGRTMTPAARASDARAAQIRYLGWSQPRVDANVSRLAATLDLLSAHGIRTVLVLPPYTEDYRRLIPPAYRDGFRHSIAELMDRCHDDRVEYRDYSASPLFTPDMFRDADHLNYRGAMILTYLLDRPKKQQADDPVSMKRISIIR